MLKLNLKSSEVTTFSHVFTDKNTRDASPVASGTPSASRKRLGDPDGTQVQVIPEMGGTILVTSLGPGFMVLPQQKMNGSCNI